MRDIFNIFYISSEGEFNSHALKIFNFQYLNNAVYREYCSSIGKSAAGISHYSEIPFLPVTFFKSHDVVCGNTEGGITFLSSGTTGQIRSRHIVRNTEIYKESLRNGFRFFFDDIDDYDVFGLMPSPEENPSSSLIFMVNEWIKDSGGVSGFYYNDRKTLIDHLSGSRGRKKLLIGLTYALLDLAEEYPCDLSDVMIMETGGMKGRRREMIREEVHDILKKAFNVEKIMSEYGMTELLSQAYSKGDGIFFSPPWMKILIRDTDDPFSWADNGRTGGISIIDLANTNSCSFIAVQDLGKSFPDGAFTVLGRFDDSEARGCNLMAE